MKLLCTTILICFIALSLLGQTTNPFDIGVAPAKSETQATSETSTIAEEPPVISNIPDNPKSDNPFDIGNHQESSVGISAPVAQPKVAKNQLAKRKSNKGPSDLLTLIYSIFMLALLTLSISLDRTRFKSILQSIFNSNYLKNLQKESKAWTDPQSLILYFLFFANAAFLGWLINARILDGALPPVWLLFIGILVAYLVRHSVMTLITYVYQMSGEAEIHSYTIGLYNMIVGILLIPFILGIGFIPADSSAMILLLLGVVVGILYVLRQVQGGMRIISMRDFNVFYFFIYLCAIEIAPILITWKVVSGTL